ncbi:MULTISPECIES: hypothetical protein [Streptomyces]|nr:MULTISPECIES: hypothetical protein [Streptomyces]MYS99338.1 hypothetical protein [Streptomyces sp. SID5469]
MDSFIKAESGGAMSDVSDPNDESEMDNESEGDPLSGWSRFAAGFTGLALSSVGAAAVFMTNNQAGSVALILGGIVFLLMLVSGNPLLSFGHGDTQMKFATKRRRERAIEEAREASPQEARRALDVLRTVDPGAGSDVNFMRTSALVYERLIVAELTRLFPEYGVLEQGVDLGADLRVVTPDQRSVSIEMKYLTQKSFVSAQYVRQLLGMASISVEGHLLVSNRALTRPAAELLSDARRRGIKVEFSRWRDEQDNGDLYEAVSALLHADGGAS